MRWQVASIVVLGVAATITAALLYLPQTLPVSTSPHEEANTMQPDETDIFMKPLVIINEAEVQVDVVTSPKERAAGLSGRRVLAPKEGMLFVFQAPGIQGFWMKDMNFPIDIIWISEDMRVIGIDQHVTPETYPQIFSSPGPVTHVLEVNAGWYERNAITIGDEVTIDMLE